MEKNEQLLHEKFVKYGASAKAWIRQCVMLLPEIEKHQIWKKKSFGSIYEYAAKLAGMSHSTVDDALRILEKIENKPNLRLVAENKGLGAVRPVVAIATPGNEKFWAQKAAAMSKHTLETYVQEYKKQSALDFRPGTEFRVKEESERSVNISMDLEPETATLLLKLKGQGDWNTLMQEFLKLREEKLAMEAPEPVINATRYIPTRIKRHVLRKTNGQCAYPGCAKPYKILHHTQRFALEKTHDPERLTPLCKGHEAIVHHGLIENETETPENWQLRDHPERLSRAYAIDRKVMEYRKSI